MTPGDEIRAYGLVCPSCHRNWADLYGRHNLIIAGNQAECRDGQPVDLDGAPYDTVRETAHIALIDRWWFRADRTSWGHPRPPGDETDPAAGV